MNKQIKVSIVVLLLATIVGFATISLTLNFTGNINIKGSYDNFSNGVILAHGWHFLLYIFYLSLQDAHVTALRPFAMFPNIHIIF